MPKGTPFVKVEHTRDFGANVIIDGETLADAERHSREIAKKEELIFVHPFDDEDIIAGQGTVGLEILEDVADLDVLVDPDRRRRADRRHRDGDQGASKPAVGDLRRRAGHVSLASPPSCAARQPKVGGQTIAEGIAVKEVGRHHLRDSSAR